VCKIVVQLDLVDAIFLVFHVDAAGRRRSHHGSDGAADSAVGRNFISASVQETAQESIQD
jgi:hypothetical protein